MITYRTDLWSAALYCLLLAATSAFGQHSAGSAGSPGSSDCQDIRKHITKEYDRFKRTTTLRLDELLLLDRRSAGGARVTLVIEAGIEEKDAGIPPYVRLRFKSVAQRPQLRGEEAIFLADGDPVEADSAVDANTDVFDPFGRTRHEAKDVRVRFSNFRKMAAARVLEMRLGTLEVQFDDKVMKAVRDFAACSFGGGTAAQRPAARP